MLANPNMGFQGWQKGVPGMKIGGIRRITVPAKMAYGERGRPPKVPANADVVFVIELTDALQVTDDKVGDGEEISGLQNVCVAAVTMKDADGKEVFKAPRDKPYIWIPGEMTGVSFGMDGMKTGGKRTLKFPKEMASPAGRPSGLPTTLPQNLALTVEVELLHVRNLMPAQPKK